MRNLFVNDKYENALKYVEEESVDLIFADPPYNIGVDYGYGIDDRLPHPEYIKKCVKWFEISYSLLKETGSFYIVHYPEICAEWLPILKDVGFIHRKWISWIYPSNIGFSNKNYTTAHRTILFQTKTDEYTFNPKADALPYRDVKDKRNIESMKNGSPGIIPYNWWDINLVKSISKEYAGWANQIPIAITNRVIKTSSNAGDIVLDPFSGSGTTAVSSVLLDRNYIVFDVNPESEKIMRSRIQELAIQRKLF